MDCKVEKMPDFKVIGFYKDIAQGTGFQACPKFWDRIKNKYFSRLDDDSPISRAIQGNNVGELAVCIHSPDNPDYFGYMIAGFYKGGDLPVGMTMYELKHSKWAKFRCIGAMPNAIQELSERIWKEWVPNSTYYEPLGETCIEWYSNGDTNADDYVAEIWLPVRDKPLTK
mgnify:CR=1 FL=1